MGLAKRLSPEYMNNGRNLLSTLKFGMKLYYELLRTYLRMIARRAAYNISFSFEKLVIVLKFEYHPRVWTQEG